jgi:hypothetical protein
VLLSNAAPGETPPVLYDESEATRNPVSNQEVIPMFSEARQLSRRRREAHNSTHERSHTEDKSAEPIEREP